MKEYKFDAISLMPTNLYGPHDNYDLNDSHVLPALIRSFMKQKEKSTICYLLGFRRTFKRILTWDITKHAFFACAIGILLINMLQRTLKGMNLVGCIGAAKKSQLKI